MWRKILSIYNKYSKYFSLNHIYIYIWLNMFLSLNFQWTLSLVHFETLDQFSTSSFEIRGFSPFNQILLVLFNVSYAFQVQDCIWIVYIVWHIFALMLSQILIWNVLKMSNKLTNIWLKELNLIYIFQKMND